MANRSTKKSLERFKYEVAAQEKYQMCFLLSARGM